MCIIDETRVGRKGVFLTPCIPIFSGQLIPISRPVTEDPGRKIAPLLVGVCRAAGGTQRVATVEGWRGSVARPPAGQHGVRDCFSRLARDVRAGPPRDFTSERSDGKSRSSPKPRRERDWDLW